MGEPVGPEGLPVGVAVARQGVHRMGGGPGRVHSWLGAEEGTGNRDGKGLRRWGGRRRVVRPQSRRRSGRREWLVGAGEGPVGCSTLGWWRAGH